MARSPREQLGVDLPESEPVVEEPVVEEPVAEERPGWLPEKFKTPEDFARAYQESENHVREAGVRQSSMEAQIQALTEAVESIKPQQRQQDGYTPEDLAHSYEQDPLGTMAWLAQQAAYHAVQGQMQEFNQRQAPQQQSQYELVALAADNSLHAQYQDWGDYKERVAEAIRQDQTLLPQQVLQSPEQTARALSNVYKMVKADDLMQQLQEMQNTPAPSNMKVTGQTLPGTLGRPAEAAEVDEKMAALKRAVNSSSYSAFRGAM